MPTIVGLYLCRLGGRLEIGVKGNFGHRSLLPTMLQISVTGLRAICSDYNELGQLPPRGADLSTAMSSSPAAILSARRRLEVAREAVTTISGPQLCERPRCRAWVC